MVGRWSPSPFWGATCATAQWMAQPPKTRTPVANLRVEWQRVACLGLGGLGKTKGKGVSGQFLSFNGGRQGQTLLVFGSVSDVSVSLKQIIWGLAFAYEIWKVIWMISMHHRLEVLNDWLTFLSINRAIGQDKKDHLWSVKRCQFQEEGHLPSVGHFGGY